MEEIAAGKGRRPKPFMLAGKAAASDAVWHSNRDGKPNKASFLSSRSEASQRPRLPAEASYVKDAAVRRAAALQPSVSRPPVGADWVHEIKLDGYRIQLRVAEG